MPKRKECKAAKRQVDAAVRRPEQSDKIKPSIRRNPKATASRKRQET